MNKVIVFILLHFFSLTTYSQKNIDRPIPIKDCKSLDDLYKDTIFSKIISTLYLDLSNYDLMYITDFVNYRDSLIRNKEYFKTLNIVINYKNIVTPNVYQTTSSYNDQNNLIITAKKLMCYRTILPDENQMYRIYFSFIE